MEFNISQIGNATLSFLACAVTNIAVFGYVLRKNRVNRKQTFSLQKYSIPSSRKIVISKER